MVSVIMPCFNMEKFITDAIWSVQQQTYPHWELLIVDDASTDGTVTLVEQQAQSDPRIQIISRTVHSGIAASRNQCIQQAQGQYLAFLDADDIWYPDKLETQLKLMTAQKLAFTYSSYNCIDENGQPLNKTVKAAGNLSYEAFLHNTIIGCSTVMVDRMLVSEVVVPNFRTSEDTATWLDILKQGHWAYAIDEPLVGYRIRRRSASSNKLKASYDLWTVYRRHEEIPFFKALGYFASYAFNAIKKRL